MVEWIAAGAICGVKVFFGLVAFLLCVGALAAIVEIIAIISKLVGGAEDDIHRD